MMFEFLLREKSDLRTSFRTRNLYNGLFGALISSLPFRFCFNENISEELRFDGTQKKPNMWIVASNLKVTFLKENLCLPPGCRRSDNEQVSHKL